MLSSLLRSAKGRRNKLIEQQVERFNKLQSIDSTTKLQLLNRITDFIVTEERGFYKFRITYMTMLIVFSAWSFIYLSYIIDNTYNFLVADLFYKRSYLFQLHSNGIDFIFIFYSVILIGILVYLAIRLNLFLLLISTIFQSMIEIFILTFDWSKEIHYIINDIAAALLASIIANIIIMMLILIVSYVVDLSRSWLYYARYPLPILVDTLITLLHDAESAGDNWVLLEYKRRQILYLERAAKCIEYYFPRRLQSGDVITNTWMKETARQFAAALREKKKWILVPKKDTTDYFVKSIASVLICVVSGDWDALERAEPEKLSLPEARRVILVVLAGILRAVLIAGLPILGFWVLQQTSLAFTGIVREYMIIGLFIWDLLTFVILLDPNFNTKISALKDILSLVFPTKVNS